MLVQLMKPFEKISSTTLSSFKIFTLRVLSFLPGKKDQESKNNCVLPAVHITKHCDYFLSKSI